ncbi:hypothetical protein O1611_g5593 [Lasiodiplodia mahajangana]|uniref:Uncharacterized protein n=1 Tax=Lasiodiplodia mahajangana TaxID=1108764 RepID=A0ACC2JKL8_9PEZI|nr:hypothetical protein O1611_g5593 [Lasiodiplodia mahajangana]
MWAYVEAARFEYMAMTRQGTVVFHDGWGKHVFIDQEALEEGRLMVCDTEDNGQVMFQARMWPVWSNWLNGMVCGLGKPIKSLEDHGYFRGQPLDMRAPILDILDSLDNYEGGEPEWTEDIERYAPGYLEMERAAMVADEVTGGVVALVRDYDHSRFVE